MRDFLKGVRFKILIALLTVMVGFMIAAVYSGGTATIGSQLLSAVTVPIQRLSTRISAGVSETLDKYLGAARTYEENRVLREQIAELQSRLVDYEKYKHVYEQMEEIADVREKHKGLAFAPAAVIERDPVNPYYSFRIDKGRIDDIELYDPVMNAEGLVGYVTEVSLNSSTVTTIVDVNINIGASNSATRDIGIVTGTVDLAREAMCIMEYLPRESGTKVGDVIVTSGSGIFPKELVIGTVTHVATSSLGNSLEATIRPAADVRVVKDVFVITDFEGQGAE